MLDDNLPHGYVEEDENEQEQFEEILAECEEVDFTGSLLNDDER